MSDGVTLRVIDAYSLTWYNKSESFKTQVSNIVNNFTKHDVNKATTVINKSFNEKQNNFTINNYMTRGQKPYSDNMTIKIKKFDEVFQYFKFNK